MRRLLPVPVLALALLVAQAAHADHPLLYAGAGISRDKLSDISDSVGCCLQSLDNTSWKVFAGFRPLSPFAIEANYMDLGSQTTNFVDVSAHSRYRAFAGYAVAFLPVPVPYLDLFAKAGLARWDSSGGGTRFPTGSLFSLSRNGTSFAWGAGGQVHAGRFGARLEYESFNVPRTRGAQVISLEAILGLL